MNKALTYYTLARNMRELQPYTFKYTGSYHYTLARNIRELQRKWKAS